MIWLIRKARGQMDTLQKSVNMKPALPMSLPARRTVPFAPRVAALACDSIPALLRRKFCHCHLGQIGHQLYDLVWHRLTGGRLWRQTSDCTQLQEADSYRSKQAQETPQSLIGLQLSLFNAASCFKALMIVFHDPTSSIPINSLPSLLDSLHWH